MIPTTAVAVIQKNKYRILSPPLAGTSCEGHFICPFCREGSSCPHCNFLPDGRSRHNPVRSHPNPKVSLTGAERAMRLAVPPSGSFTAAAVAYFPLSVLSFLTSSPYFLSLRGVGEESISRGKSKTKTSPCGLVFVFREIIEFKFKRVYLRSFFIETSEPDAI